MANIPIKTNADIASVALIVGKLPDLIDKKI